MSRSSYLFALLVVGGCDVVDLVTPPICTADIRPAISITPLDASTNTIVQAAGKAVARDGAYADSTTHATPAYHLAPERAGTYSVSVEVAGYQRWQLDRVVVGRDECHVITMPLAARLNRIP